MYFPFYVLVQTTMSPSFLPISLASGNNFLILFNSHQKILGGLAALLAFICRVVPKPLPCYALVLVKTAPHFQVKCVVLVIY